MDAQDLFLHKVGSLELINELELRRLLQQRMPAGDLKRIISQRALDSRLPWDERRPFWAYLFLSHNHHTLAKALSEALSAKMQVPFDLIIPLIALTRHTPKPVIFEALLKGLKKQSATAQIMAAQQLDAWDSRLAELRAQFLDARLVEQRQHKQEMLEKYEFLSNQRMMEQAGRLLRRMVELYPEDQAIQKMRHSFDEHWAREVLANHANASGKDLIDRTHTAPSQEDQKMIQCFLQAGEKLCLDNRAVAADIALAFLFMEEFEAALEILTWGESTFANDWLRAELMVMGRRYIEALEWINHLEVKYIDDPESTFATAYLRAQCLKPLGEDATAIDILRGILNVRPSYRSAHALLMEWTAGVKWD